MAGSQPAAETRNGEAVVHRGDRLRRFLFVSGLAVNVTLAACSAAPPAPALHAASAPTPSTGTEAPAQAELIPVQPLTARRPELPALTGMASAELMALLGEPDFRRPEPPAELWQYRTADCVLDIFLYVDGDRYRVLTSATRDRHVAPPAIASCTAAFGRRDDASRL